MMLLQACLSHPFYLDRCLRALSEFGPIVAASLATAEIRTAVAETVIFLVALAFDDRGGIRDRALVDRLRQVREERRQAQATCLPAWVTDWMVGGWTARSGQRAGACGGAAEERGRLPAAAGRGHTDPGRLPLREGRYHPPLPIPPSLLRPLCLLTWHGRLCCGRCRTPARWCCRRTASRWRSRARPGCWGHPSGRDRPASRSSSARR